MPSLNWRDAPIEELTQAITDPPALTRPGKGASQVMSLGLTRARFEELRSELDAVWNEPEGARELRLELRDEWIVFWKVREGDSRLLLAHPEPGQWIATVALERGAADRLLELFAEAPTTIDIGKLTSLNRVSNLEIRLSLLPEAS